MSLEFNITAVHLPETKEQLLITQGVYQLIYIVTANYTGRLPVNLYSDLITQGVYQLIYIVRKKFPCCLFIPAYTCTDCT
jgi:hypothetical protein